jgi:hypothetical protein
MFAPSAKQAIEEYRREKLWKDDEFLARPGWDPYHETLQHYRERLPDYERARLLRCQYFIGKTKPPKPWPKLREHVDWLVRFRVGGEKEDRIATSAGLKGQAGHAQVKRVIRDLSQLIGLTRLTPSRGHTDVNSTSDLKDARDLRVKLTRRFQAARKEGSGVTGPLYFAEIRNAIDEELSNLSDQERSDLFSRLKRGHLKASDAASRISADKYGLSLRRVRAGRSPKAERQPTPRRVEPFSDQIESRIAKRALRRPSDRSRSIS